VGVALHVVEQEDRASARRELGRGLLD
jgi:hypothetical protein